MPTTMQNFGYCSSENYAKEWYKDKGGVITVESPRASVGDMKEAAGAALASTVDDVLSTTAIPSPHYGKARKTHSSGSALHTPSKQGFRKHSRHHENSKVRGILRSSSPSSGEQHHGHCHERSSSWASISSIFSSTSLLSSVYSFVSPRNKQKRDIPVLPSTEPPPRRVRFSSSSPALQLSSPTTADEKAHDDDSSEQQQQQQQVDACRRRLRFSSLHDSNNMTMDDDITSFATANNNNNTKTHRRTPAQLCMQSILSELDSYDFFPSTETTTNVDDDDASNKSTARILDEGIPTLIVFRNHDERKNRRRRRRLSDAETSFLSIRSSSRRQRYPFKTWGQCAL